MKANASEVQTIQLNTPRPSRDVIGGLESRVRTPDASSGVRGDSFTSQGSRSWRREERVSKREMVGGKGR